MSEKCALRVLIGRDEIRDKVEELGRRIAADFPADELCVIGVLKGSFLFMADLVRAIPRPVMVDFVGAASYGEGTVSSGEVVLTKDLSLEISGRDVIVVEDIVDTGVTLDWLLARIQQRSPRTLQVVSLLDKPSRHQREISIDYLGFEIPNHFVVGYGMDHAERYRNLPDICILAE